MLWGWLGVLVILITLGAVTYLFVPQIWKEVSHVRTCYRTYWFDSRYGSLLCSFIRLIHAKGN